MRNYLLEDKVVDFFTVSKFRPRNSDEKFLNFVSRLHLLFDEIFRFTSNRNQMLKIGIDKTLYFKIQYLILRTG